MTSTLFTVYLCCLDVLIIAYNTRLESAWI